MTNGEKITEKNYRDSNECQADWDLPIQWESLPTLALPDGAHNVDSGKINNKTYRYHKIRLQFTCLLPKNNSTE